MERECVCLPNYVIGERAYFKAASVVKRFGHRTVIIGGIKAMKAGAEKLASALLEQGVELLGTVHYGGGLATYENARMLIRNELVQGADSSLSKNTVSRYRLLCDIQDHGGVLITVHGDFRVQLVRDGMESLFAQRAKERNLRLPWVERPVIVYQTQEDEDGYQI